MSIAGAILAVLKALAGAVLPALFWLAGRRGAQLAASRRTIEAARLRIDQELGIGAADGDTIDRLLRPPDRRR